MASRFENGMNKDVGVLKDALENLKNKGRRILTAIISANSENCKRKPKFTRTKP